MRPVAHHEILSLARMHDDLVADVTAVAQLRQQPVGRATAGARGGVGKGPALPFSGAKAFRSSACVMDIAHDALLVQHDRDIGQVGHDAAECVGSGIFYELSYRPLRIHVLTEPWRDRWLPCVAAGASGLSVVCHRQPVVNVYCRGC